MGFRKKIKCHYCNKEFEYKEKIFTFKYDKKECPYCGRDNDYYAIKYYEEEEKKEKEEETKRIKKQKRLKKLFAADNNVDLSFKKICEVSYDSCLVFNTYTKIVYIHHWQGYSSIYQVEHYCPFISPNGKYYKYLENEDRLVEV